MPHTYTIIENGYEIYGPDGVKIIHQPFSPNKGEKLPHGKAEQIAKLVCLKMDLGLDGLVELDEEFTLERPINVAVLQQLVKAYGDKIKQRATPEPLPTPPMDTNMPK